MRGLFVFQRDLRLVDQEGLSLAIQQCDELYLSVLIDPELSKLSYAMPLMFNALERMKAVAGLEAQLVQADCPIVCGIAETIPWVISLCETLEIESVWMNTVYEPLYLKAYQQLKLSLLEKGIQLFMCDDGIVVPFKQVYKKNNEPYKVFTPYYKHWRDQLSQLDLSAFDVTIEKLNGFKSKPDRQSFNTILQEGCYRYERLKAEIGIAFALQTPVCFETQWQTFKETKLVAYCIARDFPAMAGTSGLSVAINNGQISIKQLVRESLALLEGDCFLRQLAWRSFYQQILYAFPHVESTTFLAKYANLSWGNDLDLFVKWQTGQTGFDLIDAAMIQLKIEGKMPNRLRMLTASFLVKQLDIDWRWGEAYFYKMLQDGDLAPNNGGWQWCASTGTDAQPYFRRFNPYLQAEKFDPDGIYRQTWLSRPEIKNAREGIKPCVDLKQSAMYVQMKYKNMKL